MFRSLKEKLKLFQRKAAKELQKGTDAGEEDKSKTSDAGHTGKADLEKDNAGVSRSELSSTKDKSAITLATVKPSSKDKMIRRKRSQVGVKQGASLKRQFELETSDQQPWNKIDKKSSYDDEKVGWFAKGISEGKLDSILWDLEVALLESDVALPVIDKIKESLKNELLGKKFKHGLDINVIIEESLKNAVINVLQTDLIHFDEFIEKNDKPVKLMFVGVNGTGKTSAIAKIAFRLKKQKRSCVIAAGDTFRAGAIEQLEKHAKKLGIKLIKDKAGSDPAAIAFDTIEHAKARHKEVVLIDTAGRMQTNMNLMDEMKKIKRVVKPDLIIFVGDALAGNDVVEQAIQFENVVGIDAAILTKLDADAKGGAALSIAHAVGKPILFFSVGQRYGDIVPFNPEWLVGRLFE